MHDKRTNLFNRGARGQFRYIRVVSHLTDMRQGQPLEQHECSEKQNNRPKRNNRTAALGFHNQKTICTQMRREPALHRAIFPFQRPKTFFSSFTQTGCTRNMHFAYKVSTTAFGQRKGCLFYDLGCRGPMTHSPCNRILWNRQSSKTRAGMPCLGCTEPEFPFFDLAPGTVFKTQTVMGVPKDMPTGVDKKGYVKLTAAAKGAAPAWAEEDIFVV